MFKLSPTKRFSVTATAVLASAIALSPAANAVEVTPPSAPEVSAEATGGVSNKLNIVNAPGGKYDEKDVYINHTEQVMGAGALAGLLGAALGPSAVGASGAIGAYIGDNGSCPDNKSLKVEIRRYSGNIPTAIDLRGAKIQSFSCVR